MILKKFFEKFTPSSLSSSSSRATQQSSSQSSLRANRSQSLNAVESSSTSSPTLLSASSHRISVSASSSSRGARQTSSASGSASGLAVSEGHLAPNNLTTMAASNNKTAAVSPTAAAVSPNAVQFRNEDENDRNYTTSRHDTSGEIDDLHLHHDHNTKLLYKNANHTYKILNQLNQMRKENQMCDVVLIIEEEEIYCHKAILVTNSPYFFAMFSSGLMETNLSRVELKDIDVDSSKELIDYMYTGELPITESNVQMLLITANLFGMINIKDSCAQFIQSQLDVNNCLGIREFADIHSCNVLVKHSDAFIDQYFSEIVQKDEFLSLEVDQVMRVVSREHLSVSSEKIVYDALLRWLTHNYEKRAPYLARVMQCVRFGLMRHDELLIISQTPMIKKNLVCMEYVSEAIHYRLVKSVENEFEKCADQFNRIRISPRVPLGLPKMMYVFGGQAPKAISTIEVYDFRSQKWAYHNDMPTKRCRAGCVFHDGRIYLIGGFNGQSRVRTVDIYCPQTREWSSGPEMISRRGTLGVGLLNDTIYAVGGFDGSTGLNSVECWNLNSEIPAWTSVAPLNVRRSSVGIAVLKQFMYVVGGYCGLTRECLSSVERYDPASSKWSMVANMNVRRSGACVNVYEGHIYVVGGHDGPQVLKSVETYDPISNKWTLIAELNVARRNAGFVIHNGLFYVIGGDDGHENLSSVEIYNPQRGLWSLLPEFLNTAKSYMSILVIEDYSSYS